MPRPSGQPRPWLAAVLAITALGCTPADAPLAGEPALNTLEDVSTALQQVGPALFEADGTARDRFEFALSDGRFRGLSLAAPARADSGKLPLVLATQQTVARGWEVGLQNNLKFAIVDEETGKLSVLPALQTAKDAEFASSAANPPAKPPAPTGAAASAVETALRRFDLAELAPAALAPGRRQITALAYDQRSNSVRTVLPGTPSAAAARIISPLPDAEAGSGTSYYVAADPLVAPGDGQEISIETGNRNGAPVLIVDGTVGLSIAAADLLPEPRTVPDRGAHRSAHAVLPMSLLVVGQDIGTSRVWNLGVPVYRESTAGSPIAVAFRVVLTGPNAATLPARRQAWLFAGGRVIGPLAVRGR